MGIGREYSKHEQAKLTGVSYLMRLELIEPRVSQQHGADGFLPVAPIIRFDKELGHFFSPSEVGSLR
jgi:hypothetical protein